MPSFLEIIANGLAINTSLMGHGYNQVPQKIEDLQKCPLGPDGDVSPDLGVSYDAYESEGSLVVAPHSAVPEQSLPEAKDQAWQSLVTATKGLLDTDRNSTQAARHFFACNYFGRLVLSQQSTSLQPDEGNSEKGQKGLSWGLEHILEKLDPELVPVVSRFLSREHVYVGQPKLEGGKTVYPLAVEPSEARSDDSQRIAKSGVIADSQYAEALVESIYRAMKAILVQQMLGKWDDNAKFSIKQQLGFIMSQFGQYIPMVLGLVDRLQAGATWATGRFYGQASEFEAALATPFPNFDRWEHGRRTKIVSDLRGGFRVAKTQTPLIEPAQYVAEQIAKDPANKALLDDYNTSVAGRKPSLILGGLKQFWRGNGNFGRARGILAFGGMIYGVSSYLSGRARDQRIEARMLAEDLGQWTTDIYDVATVKALDREAIEIPYPEFLVNGQVDNQEIEFAQVALRGEEVKKEKLPEGQKVQVTLTPKADHALCKESKDPALICGNKKQPVVFNAHVEKDGGIQLDRPAPPDLDFLDKAWGSPAVIANNTKYTNGVIQSADIKTELSKNPMSKRAAFLVSLSGSENLAQLRQSLESRAVFKEKVAQVRKRLEDVREGGRMSFDVNRADLDRAKRILGRNLEGSKIRETYVNKNRWASWANDPQADHGKFSERAMGGGTNAEGAADNFLTAKEFEAVRMRILVEDKEKGVGLKKFNEMMEHEKDDRYPKEMFFDNMLDYFAVREILNDCQAEQAQSVKAKSKRKTAS